MRGDTLPNRYIVLWKEIECFITFLEQFIFNENCVQYWNMNIQGDTWDADGFKTACTPRVVVVESE